MVRYHAVAQFDSEEWTLTLSKGDRLTGETATCTVDGSFLKDDVEKVIEDMVVCYFDWNLAPWDLELTIDWKGEAEHREWLKAWHARRERERGRSPGRSPVVPDNAKSDSKIGEADFDE